MDEEELRLTPNVLFKSFLLIAGSYIGSLILLFVVANVAFPDSMAIITGEPAEYQRILEAEPERIFPEQMFWVLLLAGAAIYFGFGALVARLAPLSSFSHVVLFSMILFAQYLQLAIGADSSVRTKLILFMAVAPIAVLLGARSFLSDEQQNVTTEAD